MLKNEFQIRRALFGEAKKQVRQKHAREFDDRDYEYMAAKLSNGETVGQFVKENDGCGKCYLFALLMGYGMQEGRIVHGFLHSLDFERPNGGSYDTFEHAWLEVDDDLVFDSTVKTVFDREAYEKAFQVEKTKVFSVRELLKDEKALESMAKFAVERAGMAQKEQQGILSLFPKKTQEKTKE